MEPLGVEGQTLLGEVLVADLTPDQFGPRVNPLMLNQLPSLDEHQAARVALVLVAVQLHVGLHDVLGKMCSETKCLNKTKYFRLRLCMLRELRTKSRKRLKEN